MSYLGKKLRGLLNTPGKVATSTELIANILNCLVSLAKSDPHEALRRARYMVAQVTVQARDQCCKFYSIDQLQAINGFDLNAADEVSPELASELYILKAIIFENEFAGLFNLKQAKLYYESALKIDNSRAQLAYAKCLLKMAQREPFPVTHTRLFQDAMGHFQALGADGAEALVNTVYPLQIIELKRLGHVEQAAEVAQRALQCMRDHGQLFTPEATAAQLRSCEELRLLNLALNDASWFRKVYLETHVIDDANAKLAHFEKHAQDCLLKGQVNPVHNYYLARLLENVIALKKQELGKDLVNKLRIVELEQDINEHSSRVEVLDKQLRDVRYKTRDYADRHQFAPYMLDLQRYVIELGKTDGVKGYGKLLSSSDVANSKELLATAARQGCYFAFTKLSELAKTNGDDAESDRYLMSGALAGDITAMIRAASQSLLPRANRCMAEKNYEQAVVQLNLALKMLVTAMQHPHYIEDREQLAQTIREELESLLSKIKYQPELLMAIADARPPAIPEKVLNAIDRYLQLFDREDIYAQQLVERAGDFATAKRQEYDAILASHDRQPARAGKAEQDEPADAALPVQTPEQKMQKRNEIVSCYQRKKRLEAIIKELSPNANDHFTLYEQLHWLLYFAKTDLVNKHVAYYSSLPVHEKIIRYARFIGKKGSLQGAFYLEAVADPLHRNWHSSVASSMLRDDWRRHPSSMSFMEFIAQFESGRERMDEYDYVRYLNSLKRQRFLVRNHHDRITYADDRPVVDNRAHTEAEMERGQFSPEDPASSYIYVMEASGEQFNLYIADEHYENGAYEFHHHSSFLAGRPIVCGGEIVVKNGLIVQVGNESGHYMPNIQQLRQAIIRMNESGFLSPDCQVRVLGIEIPKDLYNPEKSLSITLFMQHYPRLLVGGDATMNEKGEVVRIGNSHCNLAQLKDAVESLIDDGLLEENAVVIIGNDSIRCKDFLEHFHVFLDQEATNPGAKRKPASSHRNAHTTFNVSTDMRLDACLQAREICLRRLDEIHDTGKNISLIKRRKHKHPYKEEIIFVVKNSAEEALVQAAKKAQKTGDWLSVLQRISMDDIERLQLGLVEPDVPIALDEDWELISPSAGQKGASNV